MPECIALTLNDMYLLTEIVDPVTAEPADEGELVFTTLSREAMPLNRYRTGDRACWQACPCQLPFKSIRLLGRADDMLVVNDMGLNGQGFADRVAELPGNTGRVKIVLDKVDLTDRLIIRVEGAVDEAVVRCLFFDIYPEMEENYRVGNVFLKIETGADLSHQIKGMRIRDRRTGDQIT